MCQKSLVKEDSDALCIFLPANFIIHVLQIKTQVLTMFQSPFWKPPFHHHPITVINKIHLTGIPTSEVDAVSAPEGFQPYKWRYLKQQLN